MAGALSYCWRLSIEPRVARAAFEQNWAARWHLSPLITGKKERVDQINFAVFGRFYGRFSFEAFATFTGAI